MSGLGDEAFAATLREEIQAFYDASPHELGWRFLYGPASTLSGARIAFIGANPGGSEIPADHSVFSSERGSVYRIERWKDRERERPAGEHRLQKRVLLLFDRLGVDADDVLAGNLVPFRSPSWALLSDRPKAVEFGTDLWRRVLRRANTELIVCMGNDAFFAVHGTLGQSRYSEAPANCGNGTIRTATVIGGAKLVGIPHLSRSGVMTRAESQPALAEAFGGFWS